jgi:hypothetical protein
MAYHIKIYIAVVRKYRTSILLLDIEKHHICSAIFAGGTM